MTRTQKSRSPADRAEWITLAVVMAAFVYMTLATATIQIGEFARDAFCAEHGWAV